MPLLLEHDNQQAHNNPEITIGPDGKEVSPKEIMKVDPQGYVVTDEQLDQASKPEATETEKKEQKEAKPSEAEARKLFLKAQKAERRAAEMEKKAKENLQRAEAFDAARELAASGKDPTALLKAANIDPIKFYQDMTTFALKEPAPTETPQEKVNREHKEQLEAYKKANEELAKSIQDKEELAQHNKNIQEQVIPLIQNNMDKYESLLQEYGTNAAVEVYKQVWELYQQKGEVISFEAAADQLEKYWSDKIESGIKAASKMKKFRQHFAQNNETQDKKPEQQDTPNRSFTLSNKQPVSSQPSNNGRYDRYLTADQRAAEILKKFGN